MLDTVKEEYRDDIEIAYTKLLALLDNDEFYTTDNYTNVDDLELSKNAYKEMAFRIYSGESNIGSLERKKVSVYKTGSFRKEKVDHKFRKVFFIIPETRIRYCYVSVINKGYDNNERCGQMQISEIEEKLSAYSDRAYNFYPYINQQAIDSMDELIEICFKRKNRSKLKEVEYTFERNIKDVVSSHLTKTIRDRKINSVLC